MKLPRRKPEEPPVEIRVTVPPELIASLKAYCSYYESTYGDPIELPAVTVEILTHFLRAERQFRRWCRGQKPEPTRGV